MADWYVGQRVVCVDDTRSPGWVGYKFNDVREGSIYTIRAINADEPDYLAFHLEEVINEERLLRDVVTGHLVFEEMWFYARRFRPLVESTSDISVFTRILGEVNDHAAEKRYVEESC